ncbi:4-alpha-glucanotransferase [Oscillatoria sp. CS-180]|uniref:4-alpha-glucanotransferase n=1 Tax=Oscillatoria sp. CS-180 TaxID=3021720 RepID=UPI00232C2E01|nr:4-alpha-glucanotransferase [Oscillatoria sp. CS-180]MDB9528128.1 4-alpha-glucanotransferase [Oscillatoria sp. CS-180]
MPFQRASGILLHPTSFPGPFGMGDLGPTAYQFVDFLAETGQQIWQVLPLGPTGHGNSPYMSYSAMAGNHMLISLEQLRDRGLLSQDDLDSFPHFPEDAVEYSDVLPEKLKLLEKAAEAFHHSTDEGTRAEYDQFCQERAFWLDDYAFFMAAKRAHEGASWNQWHEDLARRKPQAMVDWHDKLSKAIAYHKYFQFEFDRQWASLKQYANERHIQIVGDMPIYVAHDSVDVWAFPDNFMIDEETLEPSEMAGVPPDYFSETGQLWGNPTYDWDVLKKRGFGWWLQRLKSLLSYVDLIRIDHFRGFQAYWAVKEGETTAINGQWIEAPGEAFFTTVREEFGSLPILAEDLGLITPEVEALRDKFDFPGMKILQFAFGGDHTNPYLPFNYVQNSLVYTGTHDNDTTVGWFDRASEYERDRVLQYIGGMSGEGIHWSMIRLALSSISNQAIIPLQDVLGLGSFARMNSPGKAEGNWGWRYRSEMLTGELRERLRELTRLYGRAPAHWN